MREEILVSTLATLADGLEAGPVQVRQVVRGLSEEQIRARPVPGKWSILEVVCHLADSDQAWAHRIKRVIAEELPLLIGYDETRFAAALGYHARTLNEELEFSERTRRQLAQIVRGLKAGALTHEGIHERAGKMNLQQMLQIEIDHFEHHLTFLVEKRKALGTGADLNLNCGSTQFASTCGEALMSRIAPMVEEYLAGPAILRAAIAGMSPQQLQARPIAGKWTTLEVVCHLADFDSVLAHRMKQIIAFDRPQMKGIDENHYTAALAYSDREVEEELAILTATRAQMARILRKLPDAALERVGVHNERGPLTLEQMLGFSIRHIVHHAGFISEKKKAMGIG